MRSAENGQKRQQLSEKVSQEALQKNAEKRINDLTTFNQEDIKISKALRAQVGRHLIKLQQENAYVPVNDLRTLASAAEAAQRIGRLALGAATESSEITGADGGPISFSAMSYEEIPDDPVKASVAY